MASWRPFRRVQVPIVSWPSGANGRSALAKKISMTHMTLLLDRGQLVLQSGKNIIEVPGPGGYGSIPINTIFRGMNIHLPAILMWTTGVLLVLTHCLVKKCLGCCSVFYKTVASSRRRQLGSLEKMIMSPHASDVASVCDHSILLQINKYSICTCLFPLFHLISRYHRDLLPFKIPRPALPTDQEGRAVSTCFSRNLDWICGGRN